MYFEKMQKLCVTDRLQFPLSCSRSLCSRFPAVPVPDIPGRCRRWRSKSLSPSSICSIRGGSFISQINSDNEVVVEPRVSGFLVARHYKKGMPVRKGQLIFEIDDSEYYTALLSARAALESSRALALEARTISTRCRWPRSMPSAVRNSTNIRRSTPLPEADVKSARQALRNAQLNLGYTKIYAQIDGIIESSNGSVGDYVGPGTQNSDPHHDYEYRYGPGPHCDSDDAISSVGQQSDEYLRQRRTAFEIVFYEADGTRYPLFGKYDYTRTAVSSATGTIVLIVRFPNPSYRLKTGQFARVEANIGAKLPRVLVPQQSVVQTLDVSSVWVIRPDSTAEYLARLRRARRSAECGPSSRAWNREKRSL